ncbi:glycosyltransferase [Seonamhaeicola marinus]|uniref:Glycosyltransferase n=1 Tax=Seonamhaeicola marinus TaxID=1912246 RepID=A0A5D0HKP8_9FLAO|nr:glycosyltransferase [Seonamhaeicola marinus]TYA71868.1 glycosyltransferase [Seonamhaeicola marinus]
MEKIKISIIIPVYNVEAYIDRCLESVINQTHKNLEILLINDGATDNSGKLCDDYALKDSRIKVIHQKNKGLSGARNTGLKLATGDYISFIDSDDWVEANMLELMLEISLKQNVDLVECNLQKLTEIDNSISRSGTTRIESKIEALKRIVSNQSFSVWRRLYKAHLVNNIKFVEGKNSEDVYFTISVFKSIEKIAYSTMPLYNYFIGGTSITRGGYRLKTLDTVDAAIYLEKEISKNYTNKDLLKTSIDFLVTILLYNYKQLNTHTKLDPQYTHRKKLKKLIKEYYKSCTKNSQIILANYAPISLFSSVINLYRNND